MNLGKVKFKIGQILTSGEEIEMIVPQCQHIFRWIPDYVVITDRRLIIYRAALFGSSFSDFLWWDLSDAHISEQMFSATFSMQDVNGQRVALDGLPKELARKLYRTAQEMEEDARAKRRELVLEEKRAGASVVNANVATAAQPVDAPRISATTKLKDLKDMFDSDLISESEFDAKKSEILEEM